jgi:hypothetical protein
VILIVVPSMQEPGAATTRNGGNIVATRSYQITITSEAEFGISRSQIRGAGNTDAQRALASLLQCIGTERRPPETPATSRVVSRERYSSKQREQKRFSMVGE